MLERLAKALGIEIRTRPSVARPRFAGPVRKKMTADQLKGQLMTRLELALAIGGLIMLLILGPEKGGN